MMKAIGVTTCGGPEVLHVVELPQPHAGAGEVRMRVHAASVNPALPLTLLPLFLQRIWLPAVSKEGKRQAWVMGGYQNTGA